MVQIKHIHANANMVSKKKPSLHERTVEKILQNRRMVVERRQLVEQDLDDIGDALLSHQRAYRQRCHGTSFVNRTACASVYLHTISW